MLVWNMTQKMQNVFFELPQMLLLFIIQSHPEHLRPFTCFFFETRCSGWMQIQIHSPTPANWIVKMQYDNAYKISLKEIRTIQGGIFRTPQIFAVEKLCHAYNITCQYPELKLKMRVIYRQFSICPCFDIIV